MHNDFSTLAFDWTLTVYVWVCMCTMCDCVSHFLTMFLSRALDSSTLSHDWVSVADMDRSHYGKQSYIFGVTGMCDSSGCWIMNCVGLRARIARLVNQNPWSYYIKFAIINSEYFSMSFLETNLEMFCRLNPTCPTCCVTIATLEVAP